MGLLGMFKKKESGNSYEFMWQDLKEVVCRACNEESMFHVADEGDNLGFYCPECGEIFLVPDYIITDTIKNNHYSCFEYLTTAEPERPEIDDLTKTSGEKSLSVGDYRCPLCGGSHEFNIYTDTYGEIKEFHLVCGGCQKAVYIGKKHANAALRGDLTLVKYLIEYESTINDVFKSKWIPYTTTQDSGPVLVICNACGASTDGKQNACDYCGMALPK